MTTSDRKTKIINALMIGSMCSFSYFAVYIARNTLGAVTPQIIGAGVFTTEEIGTLSSIYFISYAVGQLINGAIGDRIKAKYMISFGLILAGISNIIFTVLSNSLLASFTAYGFTGFFLSMIYGPMTKVVAENTEPIYVTRCSLGYTFASFFGSPMAGVLAALFTWQLTFTVNSISLIIMGIICFIVFCIFEHKGIVKYGQYKKAEKSSGNIKVLVEHRIIRFTIISVITGIIRTTVVFWLPTYLTQYLGFSAENSALIYTGSTFILSATAFIAIFIYERLKHNMDLTMLISFSVSCASFLMAFFIKQPVINITCLIMAILSSGCATSMLWSRYCPGLRDTGMVSTATGFLDFASYAAASVSSTLFANAVSSIGWGWLIIIWFGLMAIGVVIMLPVDKLIKRSSALKR